jgi:hypothetical protein
MSVRDILIEGSELLYEMFIFQSEFTARMKHFELHYQSACVPAGVPKSVIIKPRSWITHCFSQLLQAHGSNHCIKKVVVLAETLAEGQYISTITPVLQSPVRN